MSRGQGRETKELGPRKGRPTDSHFQGLTGKEPNEKKRAIAKALEKPCVLGDSFIRVKCDFKERCTKHTAECNTSDSGRKERRQGKWGEEQ